MRRTLPPLNALRAFEAAARHLSFTRAADELCVTPSAVGQSARALERWLGVSLFARDRSSVDLVLTEAGRAYLPLVSCSLDWIATATTAVRRQDNAREVLSISSRPAFALHWLVPNVVVFQLEHPDLDVRVSTAHGGNATAAMEDGADLSVGYGHPGTWVAPLRAAPLLPDALTPVTSPSVADQVRTPADLAAAPLIQSRSASQDWPEWALACGLLEVAVRLGGPVVADRSLAIEAALAGRGIALCDLMLVARPVRAGALVAPFPQLRLVRGTAHCLLWQAHRSNEPKIALFREWIMARCKGYAAA
jgi:LysR family transcriptional regulator, glycine cleavage system transcriptional activator